MKAIVQTRYGPPERVCTLAEIDAPVPRDDGVLVRVRAASLSPDVWHQITGLPLALRLFGTGFWAPRAQVPGTDCAGVVAGVGAAVTRFKVGDAVYGEPFPGQQWRHGGALAEFVAAPEAAWAAKPSTLSFEQAAAVPTAGLIALRCLREEGALAAGHRVLVNGAGGGVGSLGVLIAKAAGAHVTAVDHSDKLGMLDDLGADAVLDYERDDFTRLEQPFDVVLDIPGNRPWKEVRRIVAPHGKYVLVGHDRFDPRARPVLGGIGQFLPLAARAPFNAQLPRGFAELDAQEGLAELTALAEARRLAPFVDAAFPLERFQDAMAALTGGGVKGKIVVTP